MNVVQVTLFEDTTRKRYTYKLPPEISLKKGYIVRVKNSNGKEVPATCVTDSEELSDNAVDMVMAGKKVTADVIGIYSYIDFKLAEAAAAAMQ